MKHKFVTIHFTHEEAARKLKKVLSEFEVKSVYLYTKDEWIRHDDLWELYDLLPPWKRLYLWLRFTFRKLVERYHAVLYAYGFDREAKTEYDLTCFFYKPFQPVLWDGSGYNMVYWGHVEKIYEKGLEVEVEGNEVRITIPPGKWLGYINRLLLGWETLCRGEKTSA
ncbi:MAG: hypothetical protein DRP11_00465 [Candidatus Aenigmatarchaeota archaeon]|nr:MAG: hypothetical protein DRP11_00465 [Candidatus Aenigmarchaeota archaeon]